MDINSSALAPPPGAKHTPEDIKSSFDDFNMTYLGDPLTKKTKSPKPSTNHFPAPQAPPTYTVICAVYPPDVFNRG